MKQLFILILCIVCHLSSFSQKTFLHSSDLKPYGVMLTDAHYKNKRAVRMVADKTSLHRDEIAIIKNINFVNGSIQVDLFGDRLPDSNVSARGFIGLAFRVQMKDTLQYECFYLRPTNARAEDQLRRNHTVQYISEPNHPWDKLRSESPGVYESYVDLAPGQWNRMKIEVSGRQAKLYINNAPQPCLIVNDLKLDVLNGSVALWIGPGTEAYFRNLKIFQDKVQK